MSKKEKILQYLQSGGKLTVAKALTMFKCYALSQRVGNLVKEGHSIIKETITTRTGERVTQYSMEQKGGTMIK